MPGFSKRPVRRRTFVLGSAAAAASARPRRPARPSASAAAFGCTDDGSHCDGAVANRHQPMCVRPMFGDEGRAMRITTTPSSKRITTPPSPKATDLAARTAARGPSDALRREMAGGPWRRLGRSRLTWRSECR